MRQRHCISRVLVDRTHSGIFFAFFEVVCTVLPITETPCVFPFYRSGQYAPRNVRRLFQVSQQCLMAEGSRWFFLDLLSVSCCIRFAVKIDKRTLPKTWQKWYQCVPVIFNRKIGWTTLGVRVPYLDCFFAMHSRIIVFLPKTSRLEQFSIPKDLAACTLLKRDKVICSK